MDASPLSARRRSPGPKSGSAKIPPSPIKAHASPAKAAPSPAKKATPKKGKPKAKKVSSAQRGEPVELLSARATGEPITARSDEADDADEDDELPPDAAALLAEVMAFTPRAHSHCPTPSRQPPRPPPQEQRNQNDKQHNATTYHPPHSPPSPTGAVVGRDSFEADARLPPGEYSPPPKTRAQHQSAAPSLPEFSPAAPQLSLAAIPPGSARRQLIEERLTARAAVSARGSSGGGTARAVSHSLILKAHEVSGVSDDVGRTETELNAAISSCPSLSASTSSSTMMPPPPPPLPKASETEASPLLAIRGALDIITSGDVTQRLRHVEPDDRSGPIIEAGVSYKRSAAPLVFAQIASGEGVALRHVAEPRDRSAPIIESQVVIRRDVRPSLFAEMKRKLGFGPTGAGAKRIYD